METTFNEFDKATYPKSYAATFSGVAGLYDDARAICCDATELTTMLAATDNMKQTAANIEYQAVRAYVNATGCTAAELARVLGISRQAASKRWGETIRARDLRAQRSDSVDGEQELPI